MLSHAQLGITYIPALRLVLRLGYADTLHPHERELTDRSKQVVGIGMIDPLLSQALVVADRHDRKRRFINGCGKRASLIRVTTYRNKSDASEVVGYSDKKTGGYFSG